MKYKEIYKLKEMLEKANIPFEFFDRSMDFSFLGRREKWQLCYPHFDDGSFVCSCIEGCWTYGEELDLLEINGLLTEEEEIHDSVAGYLTAEDVFARIEKHYLKK